MNLHQFALTAGAALALLTLDVHAQQAVAPSSAAVPVSAAPEPSSTADKTAEKAALKAQRKADRMLEKAVRYALAKDKSVDVTRINVRARSGAVTLLGSVPQQDQSDAAFHVAQAVTGVTSVENALTIKAAGQ
ncbi:BON domain-containing protein [Paraburkholderia dipogonis]|uniref:BON domain-containing protein n=1 Tax=Paraburkholderia dipogonis TaxID=1211383 RepID=A0A4Y8MKX7_9BURK|nr:BON domain-containing protein [Paraburkholderia dipogonis]TFE38058.1 BON domain-containing protein [Paraburkholderia dipogonis]